MQHLRGPRAVAQTGPEWGRFIESEMERGEEIDVYDQIWGPYYALMMDVDFDEAEVRAEAEAIIRWRRGGVWSPPSPRSNTGQGE